VRGREGGPIEGLEEEIGKLCRARGCQWIIRVVWGACMQ